MLQKKLRTHYANEVTKELAGKEVTVAGWVHEIRDFGAVKFVVLRDRTGLVQLTIKKDAGADEALEALVKTAESLVKETAITATGVVADKAIAKVGREIIPSRIDVVGRVLKQVPFEVTGKVPADIDVRLDNRFIDLRRIETTAVFKIRSIAQQAFREKCLALGFQEITPPCIVVSSTEGGTELFPVKYFERDAFLAQSPQLYKQLAVLGGMDEVFMIGPVFRAEKHNTTKHLNECTQMDVEIGFADDEDAMNVLEQVVASAIKRVKQDCAGELKLLDSELGVPKEIPRYTYDEVLTALKENGEELAWGEDLTKKHEEKLCEALGEIFFITQWPTKSRAFYCMPLEENPDKCRGFDLIYKGLEIASGAQRIHDPALLVKQLKAHGLHPPDFESYINAFRFGGIPHAGWSIGLERLTMKLANRLNIRECALFPRDRTRLTP